MHNKLIPPKLTMDGLALLQNKLEEVISLIESFGQDDLVKAGRIWNNFSLHLQSIINLDVDSGNESLSYKKLHTSKTKLNGSSVKSKKQTVCVTNVGESNQTLKAKEICAAIPLSQPQEHCPPSTIIPSELNSSDFDKETHTNADIQSNPVLQEEEKAAHEIHVDKDLLQEIEGTPPGLFEDTKLVGESSSGRLKGKQYTCEECGAAFSTRGNFNVHLRKHTGDKPFPCTKCSKRFNTSSNLRRHLLSHQGVKPYHCAMCDARFTERKSLIIHVRRHTGEKPFQCSICGKGYKTQWVLSQHSKIHRGDEGKAHLCHQCGKSFTQKSQLKLHEKRHSGLKPHICSYCDMPFTTKSDLRRHEKTHSGKKAFVCDQCGKSFARSQRLKDHLMKHDQSRREEIENNY